MSAYEFPKIHSFIPFYTKQPNSAVLTQQLDSWCQIILDYCSHYKITSMSPTTGRLLHSQYGDVDSLPPLFENASINRHVNEEFKAFILKHLCKLNRAELKNNSSPEDGMLVYWRTLAEWLQVVYAYVQKTGQLGSVLTIYELTSPTEGVPEDLQNIEYDLMVKVLKQLVKQGKAQILMGDDGQMGGVKIV